MSTVFLVVSLCLSAPVEGDAPLAAPAPALFPSRPPPRQLDPQQQHRRVVKRTFFIGGGLFLGGYVLGFAPLGYAATMALGGPGSPPVNVGNKPLVEAAIPVVGPMLLIADIARKPPALREPTMDVLAVAIAVVDCLVQLAGLAVTGYGVYLAAQ